MESYPSSQNFSTEEIAIYLQEYSRIILSIIILSNFLLIFLLKFKIRKNEKGEIIINDIIYSNRRQSKDDNEDSISSSCHKETLNTSTKTSKYILFIIAHPDDETMFFSPTIFSIKELKSKLERKGINIKLHILCLSNGNFYGQGKIRENEFEKVMLHMKIDKYKLINDESRFPDKDMYYKSSDVEEEIAKYIENENDDELSLIFTFDEKGVSKHKNHISCYEGLISYLKNNKKSLMSRKIQVYLLDSYGIIYQYLLQILSFLWFLIKPYGFIGFYMLRVYKSMRLYDSQFFWWRKLHVIVSVYSYFNTFTKIEFIDEEEKDNQVNKKKEN